MNEHLTAQLIVEQTPVLITIYDPGSEHEYNAATNSYGRKIGELRIVDGQMHFEGDADASARQFFDGFLKPLVDAYLKTRMGSQS